MQYQKSEYKRFVSLSNTDLQRFCLLHKPHSSILKDLFINKFCTLFLNLQNLCPYQVICISYLN